MPNSGNLERLVTVVLTKAGCRCQYCKAPFKVGQEVNTLPKREKIPGEADCYYFCHDKGRFINWDD